MQVMEQTSVCVVLFRPWSPTFVLSLHCRTKPRCGQLKPSTRFASRFAVFTKIFPPHDLIVPNAKDFLIWPNKAPGRDGSILRIQGAILHGGCRNQGRLDESGGICRRQRMGSRRSFFRRPSTSIHDEKYFALGRGTPYPCCHCSTRSASRSPTVSRGRCGPSKR